MDRLKYLPMITFGLYFLKVIILPISYPEAVVLAVLGLTACYFQFKNTDEKIKDLENQFGLAMKRFDEEMQQITKLRDTVNGLKLNSITRPLANVTNR